MTLSKSNLSMSLSESDRLRKVVRFHQLLFSSPLTLQSRGAISWHLGCHMSRARRDGIEPHTPTPFPHEPPLPPGPSNKDAERAERSEASEACE